MTEPMRYLVVRLADGETTFEHYASVSNVIRYGLRKAQYDPGQYDIHTWPKGGSIGPAHRAYKRV